MGMQKSHSAGLSRACVHLTFGLNVSVAIHATTTFGPFQARYRRKKLNRLRLRLLGAAAKDGVTQSRFARDGLPTPINR